MIGDMTEPRTCAGCGGPFVPGWLPDDYRVTPGLPVRCRPCRHTHRGKTLTGTITRIEGRVGFVEADDDQVFYFVDDPTHRIIPFADLHVGQLVSFSPYDERARSLRLPAVGR